MIEANMEKFQVCKGVRMNKTLRVVASGLFFLFFAELVLSAPPFINSGFVYIATVAASETSPGQKPLSEPAESNKPRFIDNGNDTVTDRRTGLMWMKTGRATFGAMDWQSAETYCNTLKHAGYSDWHIPSKDDWRTIISKEKENPALLAPQSFRNVVTYLDYWTRTRVAQSPGFVWAVNLYYGKGTLLNKKKNAFAWPVRRDYEIAAVDKKPVLDKAAADVASGIYLREEIRSRYTIIRYRSREDLIALDRRLKIPPSIATLFPKSAELFSRNLNARIKKKVDLIYASTQKILDMRKKMDKLVIQVYPNRKYLGKAFRGKRGSKLASYHANYDYVQHAVGINLKKASTQALGHYMALAIINNFMPVRPPVKSAQIMAAYVDQQLAH